MNLFVLLCAIVFSAMAFYPTAFAMDVSPGTHWLRGEPGMGSTLADEHGVHFIGEVEGMPGIYLVRQLEGTPIDADHPVLRQIVHRDYQTREIFVRPRTNEYRGIMIAPRDFREVNPFRSLQWNLDKTNSDCASAISDGSNHVVHVIDCGSQNHPALGSTVIAINWNPYSNSHDVTASARATHGEMAASIAVAKDTQYSGLGVSRAILAQSLLLSPGQQISNIDQAHMLRRLPNATVTNSYGPPDTGYILEKADELIIEALEFMFNHGRNGLGAVVVWASGNGGLPRIKDDIVFDETTGWPTVLAIGALAPSLDTPPEYTRASYSEGGAALAFAFPSGSEYTGLVAATGLTGHTLYFSGTSASAPGFAGYVAKLLDLNPRLTFEDVLLITADTANTNFDADWIINGAGRRWDRYLGFGLVDECAALHRAQVYTRHIRSAKFGARFAALVDPITQSTGEVAMHVSRNETLISAQLRVGLELGMCMLSTVRRVVLYSPANTEIVIVGANHHTEHSVDLTTTVRGIMGEHSVGTWKLSVTTECMHGITIDYSRTGIEFHYEVAAA